MARRTFPALLTLVFALGAALPPALAQEPGREATSLEVQIYLLVASDETPQGVQLPASLEPVAKRLRGSLQLPNYRIAETFLNRVTDHGGVQSSGVTAPLLPVQTSPSTPAFYTLAIQGVRIGSGTAARKTVELTGFRFGIRLPIVTSPGGGGAPSIQYESVGINTEVQLLMDVPSVVGTINTGRPKELFVVVAEVRQAN